MVLWILEWSIIRGVCKDKDWYTKGWGKWRGPCSGLPASPPGSSCRRCCFCEQTHARRTGYNWNWFTGMDTHAPCSLVRSKYIVGLLQYRVSSIESVIRADPFSQLSPNKNFVTPKIFTETNCFKPHTPQSCYCKPASSSKQRMFWQFIFYILIVKHRYVYLRLGHFGTIRH